MSKKKKIDHNHMLSLVREIKEKQQVKKQLEEDIEEIKKEIIGVLDENKPEEYQVDVFTVRYKFVTSSGFDSKSFKEQYPELAAKFRQVKGYMKFTID